MSPVAWPDPPGEHQSSEEGRFMPASAVRSRLHGIRTALAAREWGRLSLMLAIIAALNVVG
jgi:hypothetical protein